MKKFFAIVGILFTLMFLATITSTVLHKDGRDAMACGWHNRDKTHDEIQNICNPK